MQLLCLCEVCISQLGMPQLSMHSIREMAGVDDVLLAYKHFLAFFRCAESLGFCVAAPSTAQVYCLLETCVMAA
jgi:hypothetical protein